MTSHGRFPTTHVGGVHVGTGGVEPDVVWAKRAALAQGAELARREFWPA